MNTLLFIKYWDNTEKYHGKLLFEGYFPNILLADQAFYEKTGIEPIKNNKISAQIHKTISK